MYLTLAYPSPCLIFFFPFKGQGSPSFVSELWLFENLVFHECARGKFTPLFSLQEPFLEGRQCMFEHYLLWVTVQGCTCLGAVHASRAWAERQVRCTNPSTTGNSRGRCGVCGAVGKNFPWPRKGPSGTIFTSHRREDANSG